MRNLVIAGVVVIVALIVITQSLYVVQETEQVVVTGLTREQATLYESVVNQGLEEVELSAEGIHRRGAILTTLLRLKQICNHPAHYLGDGSALPNRSWVSATSVISPRSRNSTVTSVSGLSAA